MQALTAFQRIHSYCSLYCYRSSKLLIYFYCL